MATSRTSSSPSCTLLSSCRLPHSDAISAGAGAQAPVQYSRQWGHPRLLDRHWAALPALRAPLRAPEA
eukprot:15869-Alexandrium_andersonii.AAC.1